MGRFFQIYVSVFIVIWIGYGVYSVLTRQPYGLSVLLFGVGFSVVLIPAVWFSRWLMKSYRNTDTMTQKFLARNARNRK